MLLQARGRMTAQELARELEVSERTIYRDMDALGAAGVPVYGDRGPEGGFALLDSYRTNLTGLTEAEVRALFMLSIPAPLRDLGVGDELRSALLKLAAALPLRQRSEPELVRQRIHLDATWWFQGDEPNPHLRTVQEAVWQDRQLRIVYRAFTGRPVNVEHVVDPYGLVAKGGVWYLVCAHDGQVRSHRVAHLVSAVACATHFARPVGFDLAGFWQHWCQEFEQGRPAYVATLRVAPQLADDLPYLFHDHARGDLHSAGRPDKDGWVVASVQFESFEAARSRVLGFGRGVEVLAPEPLRLSVLDYAQQIVDLYL
jgi:predicted DNA-binding transcriptional regulator YafY